MNTKRIATFAVAALLAGAVGGGVAYAKDRDGEQDGRDVAALASMTVTLPQAIATAEQQTGGRAIGADVTQEHGATNIAVEIAGPQGVKTVLVDAQSGKITGTRDGNRETGNEDED